MQNNEHQFQIQAHISAPSINSKIKNPHQPSKEAIKCLVEIITVNLEYK